MARPSQLKTMLTNAAASLTRMKARMRLESRKKLLSDFELALPTDHEYRGGCPEMEDFDLIDDEVVIGTEEAPLYVSPKPKKEKPFWEGPRYVSPDYWIRRTVTKRDHRHILVLPAKWLRNNNITSKTILKVYVYQIQLLVRHGIGKPRSEDMLPEGVKNDGYSTFRSVCRNGDGSHFIALPADWVKQNNLQPKRGLLLQVWPTEIRVRPQPLHEPTSPPQQAVYPGRKVTLVFCRCIWCDFNERQGDPYTIRRMLLDVRREYFDNLYQPLKNLGLDIETELQQALDLLRQKRVITRIDDETYKLNLKFETEVEPAFLEYLQGNADETIENSLQTY